MTTFFRHEVKCRLCNNIQEVYDLASCTSLGPPDLDARPAEMARGAIMSLQVCPDCGYAAFDISRKIIKPEIVRDLLSNFPKSNSMTDAFYKAGIIVRQTSNNHGDAFTYFLRAAWSADDEGNISKAKEMRHLALEEKIIMIQASKRANIESLLQACDIARRAEQFAVASNLIVLLERKRMKSFIRKLIAYEKELIARKDIACHSVSEVCIELS